MTKRVALFLISTLILLAVNVLVITLFSRSFNYALDQVSKYKVYFFLIATGFGAQVVLWKELRTSKHNLLVGGTGSINVVSMAACCAHHVADFFPLLAVSGIASVLVSYQTQFYVLAIVVNWLSVAYLYKKYVRR